MFGRRNTAELLSQVMADFNSLAGSSCQALRLLIPPNEVWRFFVEKRVQRYGRHLALAPSFNIFPMGTSDDRDPRNYTVKQYIEKIEKLKMSDPGALRRSRLWKDLRKRKWRLDPEICQFVTLRELLALDRGWIPFEVNEPGYMRGVVTAFQEIFKLDRSLDLDFIEHLHGLATGNVKGTGYGEELSGRGEIRTDKSEMRFLLTKNCASMEGIKEFLEHGHPQQWVEFNLFEQHECVGTILVNGESLKAIRDFVKIHEAKAQGINIGESNPKIKKYCQPSGVESVAEFLKIITSNSELKSIVMALGKEQDNETLANFLYQCIEHRSDNVQLIFLSSQASAEVSVAEVLAGDIQSNIDQYAKSIESALSPREKVRAIVKFIQACELVHPFKDANGRTFCMLLINFLLMKEGFPPAILFDSNHLNLYSQEEMVSAVVKGMSHTIQLIREGQLFDVKTDDILRELQSRDAFLPMLNYFKEVVAIEEKGRQQQPQPDLNRKSLHQ